MVRAAFEVREEVPVILSIHCRRCHTVDFPSQRHGCVHCGSSGADLVETALAAVGEVVATVRVPASENPARPGYHVAEVRLDGGPTVRGLAEAGVRRGDRVGGRADKMLRFGLLDAP